MLHDCFSNVYRSRIDPTIYIININDSNDTIENYHANILGSDYLYWILKKCLAEYYYIRNNLRRHVNEYSLGNLKKYFNKVDTIFANTCDKLLQELIEIRNE